MSTGIKVFMGGDMTGFQEMLVKAKLSARQFSQEVSHNVGHSWGEAFSMKSLAGGVAGYLGYDALKSHLEGLIEKAESLKDLSEQFDMSTDSIQRWQKATASAGVTFTTFLRTMETLRAKREDALNDPKKLAQFGGMSADELRNADNMEALLVRILKSGMSRGAMMDLLGPRSVRLGGAAEYYEKHKLDLPALSADDIREIDMAAKSWEEAKGKLNKLSMNFGPGNTLATIANLINGDLEGAAISATKNPWNRFVTGLFVGQKGLKQIDDLKSARSQESAIRDMEEKLAEKLEKRRLRNAPLELSDKEYARQVKEQEDAARAESKLRDKWFKEMLPGATAYSGMEAVGIYQTKYGAANGLVSLAEKQLQSLLKIEANTRSLELVKQDLGEDY